MTTRGGGVTTSEGTMARRPEIEGTSPDKTVRVRMGPRNRFEVELAPDVLRVHTEGSLAAQIALAIKDAITAYGAALREFRAAQYRGQEPDAPDAEARERWRRFVELVGEMEATTRSPLGYVEVRWRGQDDVLVEIRPGALRRFSRAELVAEMAAALSAALARRGAALAKIYRQTHPATFVALRQPPAWTR